jgi:hypothetical protein
MNQKRNDILRWCLESMEVHIVGEMVNGSEIHTDRLRTFMDLTVKMRRAPTEISGLTTY